MAGIINKFEINIIADNTGIIIILYKIYNVNYKTIIIPVVSIYRTEREAERH